MSVSSLLPDELRALHFEQEVEALDREIEREQERQAVGTLYSLTLDEKRLLTDPAIRLAESISNAVGRRGLSVQRPVKASRALSSFFG